MKALQNKGQQGIATALILKVRDKQLRKKERKIIETNKNGTNNLYNFTWIYHILIKEHKKIYKQPEIVCYMRNLQTIIKISYKNTKRVTVKNPKLKEKNEKETQDE